MKANNITLENITGMIELTGKDPTEFLININWQVYGGWFFFIILWVLGIILFRLAQKKRDRPLINALYIMTTLTILSFFLRAIQVVKNGVVYALMTDYQMWIFPLIAASLAAIVRYLSNE